MADFIYRIINFFFGPSDAATARHFNEQAKQRAEPFVDPAYGQNLIANAIGDQMVARLSHKWTTSTGLKDYEAFQPAKTQPIPAPATSKKQAIFNYIKVRSPKGVTAENVGRAFPSWRYSRISARISELYKSGTIVSVGVANTSGGSLASIFAVAE
jgi:hypothetical protein